MRDAHEKILISVNDHVFGNLPCCQNSITFFQYLKNTKQSNGKENILKHKQQKINSTSNCDPSCITDTDKVKFPPDPITSNLTEQIATDYCQELHADNILESGCAVCGCLNLLKDMTDLS
ncbi:hypothetical protein DENSPDRAFT_789828, partial [Dentipellis sp. KUC8613]